VKETVDARKEKIMEDDAWKLLSDSKKIFVAKGSKVVEFETASADRFELMKTALGRSGSLRAPAIKIGDSWMVGFNPDLYETKL